MRTFFYGMIIGVANIIPGVSGGTMAVILNIYDKIISSISNLRTDFKNSLKFLIPLGLGSGIGILLFAKIIDFCLENFASATSLVFLGLILGSIPMINKKASEYNKTTSGYLCMAVAIIILGFMHFSNIDDSSTLITTLSAGSFAKLFFASFIAAGAMIIPGISGSFILLLLGIYSSILTAISNFNILILIPVGLGCGVGILVCAKIIDILFKKYPQQTYMGILGLMIGSMIIIVPQFTASFEFLIGCILCVVSAKIARDFSNK
ncbi:MAG: DUF368 domain-containing protein [Clostridia bacterium]